MTEREKLVDDEIAEILDRNIVLQELPEFEGFQVVGFDQAVREISARLAAARNEAREQCAAWVENYPSPLDDLPMALTIRDLATGLRNLKEPQ